MTHLTIHSTALIDSEAEIGQGVEIGAYAVIESGVHGGDGCRILCHAQVLSGVQLGANCVVGHGAVIGGEPQDFKFSREIRSGVEIGAGTILREHVTVHRGSREGSMTRLGVGNFLMAGS
ncbi:MAG: acyl-ACP--UDP-N-acetylglucosamine O-acyltransferase, partial [Verrucomicrobia bacterium]|nr:acyl-ACP--UDP-N-acetylglucosamine O-acyltransferase [Verrucomicrobiota bacterium]